ncbi:MAG: class IV adenylate cyclase [Patescibacteria group bacterium]|nr:class IV adenylate cyclase [Patescibacteria group bacterium]
MKNNNNKEIEILVNILDNKNNVLKKLSKFKFIKKYKVRDVYFFDPKRKDLKPDKNKHLNRCLRLRRKNEDNYLAYKIDRFNGRKWLYSDEYEIRCDNYQNIISILNFLGLKELLTINSKKYIYTYKNYEIVFEIVDKLGMFLEVEAISVPKKSDIKKIKSAINEFIKFLDIKVGKELNVGKPELMLNN